MLIKKCENCLLLCGNPLQDKLFCYQEKVSDADSSVENRIHTFYYNVYKDLDNNKVGSGCSHSFCVTINGTVYSNVLFTGRGYAKINITVNDTAGTDYTILDVRKKLFIIVKLKKKHLLSNFTYKTNQYFKKMILYVDVRDLILRYFCFEFIIKKIQISYNAVLCFKQIFWDFCIHLTNQ